jgi:hypothetical protein
LSELEEREAIKRLKYRYMRCLDQKLWDELGGCLTDDATTSYGDGKFSFQGRDAIVKFLSDAMGADSFHSSHQVHHPEIEFQDAVSATGVWALQDVVIDTENDLTLRGAAFYEDQYRKIDGEWKILHTGYRRIYEEAEPRSKVPGLRLTASFWGAHKRPPPS